MHNFKIAFENKRIFYTHANWDPVSISSTFYLLNGRKSVTANKLLAFGDRNYNDLTVKKKCKIKV